MPFRNQVKFDLELRTRMGKAYDAACARLGIDPSHPRTGILAAIIVRLATEGITDTSALCEAALAKLSTSPPSR
jgi:hypothetical protein